MPSKAPVSGRGCKKNGGTGIPDGNIENGLFALPYSHEQVENHKAERNANQNVHRPGQLGILSPLGVPEGYADNTGENVNIPENTGDNPEFFTVKLSSQQPGKEVERRCQESGCDKAKEIDVHMDRANPAKMYPFNVGHEIRGDKISCPDHPRRGGHGKPECRGEAEGLSGFVGFWHLVFRGRHEMGSPSI